MHSTGTVRGVVCVLAAFALVSPGPSVPSEQNGDPVVLTGPFVYVSEFAAGEILRVDATGISERIYVRDEGETFAPEDVVVGPDNKLYIADSIGMRIVRMDLDGSNDETVHAWSSEDFNWPEGVSFGPGDDLYFNTRGTSEEEPSIYHTGIWQLPGIAAVGVGGLFPDAIQVLTPEETGIGNGWGEGTAWTPEGDLLIVDRLGGKVVKSSPPFNSVTEVITGLGDDAVGIAVNSAGEIFVARVDLLQVLVFDPDGTPAGVWASFDDERPAFIEFDAEGNLWVTTHDAVEDEGGGSILWGNVWKVTPSQSAQKVTDDNLYQPVGIGLPAGAESITQTFNAQDNSQVYDFGDHTFIITTDVHPGSCNVTVVATETLPGEVANRMATYFPGAECVRYGGHGGDCIVYSIDPFPLPSCFVGDYIELVTKYYAEAESNPAFLHDPSDVDGDDFTEDILVSYYPDGLPGDDPAKRGRTDTFQEFVSVDLGFGEAGPRHFLGFEPPLQPDGSASFKSGRTIPVGFSAMDELGVPILDAVAKLAVARVEPSFQIMPVQPAGKSNVGTLFRITDEGKYIYNLETKGYTAGLYSVTVSSDSFPPQTVRFTIQ